MKKLIVIAALFISIAASAQTQIPAKEASKHINETVTVTGKVFNGKLIASNNMTLLDINGFNPNQDLTVMIEGTNRTKFQNKPEEELKGKEVTITGKIIDYKGKPEIVVTDPDQIKVIKSGTPAPANAERH
jgi:DNA/RNA endonuclease YhcR with UshA esterase domain